ncbi:hypothetical protein LX64_01339 [Chitinophaga skermanii]|uniref:Uncharacterized protein n=1 Tax=Chitinophaga skermanii TaxID=331697 RepID=A0A327QXJ5_9BACT|nr:hypothetical protein LX64_01339 [Chitinophaga skermanii]
MLGKTLSRVQLRHVSGGYAYSAAKCNMYVRECNDVICPPAECFCGLMADTHQWYCIKVL